MKKLLFSLVVLSFVTFSARNADAQQMYIGARIGTNLANESDDSVPSGYTLGIHPGFLAGGQFDYWFNDMWALSAQILYDQKGATENINQSATTGLGESYSITGSADLILNYLEIPVLVKASFGTGNIRPYVFVGPSFGIFLSGSEKVNATSSGFGSNTTTDTTISIPDSAVKSFDFSAVFGAGVSLKLNSGQVLFIDAAYALGLVNVSNNSNGDNTTIYSRDIRIAAGIMFPIN